jgi:hypothetical protein
VRVSGPPELLTHIATVGVVSYKFHDGAITTKFKLNEKLACCDTRYPIGTWPDDVDLLPLLNTLEACGYGIVTSHTMTFLASNNSPNDDPLCIYFNRNL